MWYAHFGDVINFVVYVTTLHGVLPKAREFPRRRRYKRRIFSTRGTVPPIEEVSTPVLSTAPFNRIKSPKVDLVLPNRMQWFFQQNRHHPYNVYCSSARA